MILPSFEQQVLATLVARQRRLPKRLRKRLPPTNPWQYPHAAERGYAKFLGKQLSQLTKAATSYLKERWPSWIAELKTDSMGEDMATLSLLLLELQNQMQEAGSGLNTLQGIHGFANTAVLFNGKQLSQILQTALETPLIPLSEPWLSPMVESFVAQNMELLQKAGSSYIDKLNKLVLKEWQAGSTWKTMAGQLQTLNAQYTQSRAKLVARDQIGKLNGMLTESRMEYAGLKMYTWSSSHDERVRGRPGGKYPKAIPSHWAIESKLCRWDDPTVYSKDKGLTWIPRPDNFPKVHPGMDIQCRCTALPYWGELLGEANLLAEEG
jgi:uncharacterized protein with gpF-like domain